MYTCQKWTVKIFNQLKKFQEYEFFFKKKQKAKNFQHKNLLYKFYFSHLLFLHFMHKYFYLSKNRK